ncbi:MAG: formylglycine-generating enzyme family protein [Pseudanabaena sp. CRU_2_10]|nr:formylglycine-generating enzyme family protein [Pseudanabaena sp. CRU_2_10]
MLGRVFSLTYSTKPVPASLPKIERDLLANPSKFKGAELPVENISWLEAIEFCARLSKYSGRTYRLPTEAEWEYACRVGTSTPFHFGETLSTDLANYYGDYTYGTGHKGEFWGKPLKHLSH